ncbi:hypothetical protein B0H13DRAFT_1851474 [Mycena leptocephala]|nr:hypothetical protein B0H13DRAFT_1851474 [Mycena leptocephala]
MSDLATFSNTLAPTLENLTLPMGVDYQESFLVFGGSRAQFPVRLLFSFSRLLRILFSFSRLLRLLFRWLLFSVAHHPATALETYAPPEGAISMGSTGSEKGARLWGIFGIDVSSRTNSHLPAPTHGPSTEHGSPGSPSAFDPHLPATLSPPRKTTSRSSSRYSSGVILSRVASFLILLRLLRQCLSCTESRLTRGGYQRATRPAAPLFHTLKTPDLLASMAEDYARSFRSYFGYSEYSILGSHQRCQPEGRQLKTGSYNCG